MTEIEEPDPRWRAIIGDGCDAVVEWMGAKGYGLMALLGALVALHVYITGDAGPIVTALVGVDVYLFVLGVATGGNLIGALSLAAEDGGDRS